MRIDLDRSIVVIINNKRTNQSKGKYRSHHRLFYQKEEKKLRKARINQKKNVDVTVQGHKWPYIA